MKRNQKHLLAHNLERIRQLCRESLALLGEGDGLKKSIPYDPDEYLRQSAPVLNELPQAPMSDGAREEDRDGNA